MKTAADILTPPVLVETSTSVRELADLLLEAGEDGAVVVEDQRVVGVVTMMDLIRKETTLHLPASFILLDAVITLPGERKRMKRELERISASTVRDLMTVPPVTVRPSATLEHCANKMFEEHLTVLPVVDEDGALHGVVTKDGLVRGAGLATERPAVLKPRD